MTRLPLQGVRVADFTWVGAGPFGTKPLADHGADVIKIETSLKPDILRLAPPFQKNQPGINRSGYFANRNTSKRSITLNLNTPQGIELAKRLISVSDVVVNNFTPGAMEKWGLSYPEVCAIRPDIIYVAMPMQGSEGPHRSFAGFGLTIAALSGIHYLSGDPDKEPVGTGTNYPDHVPNPMHAAIATVAALRHRRLTGEGQYVEVAQLESSVNVVATAVLQYTVNSEIAQRTGNRSGFSAPRCLLRCAGDDRWCAVDVQSRAQWEGLCRATGHPEWLRDDRYRDLDQRLLHQDELEAELAEWSSTLDAYDVMQRLQEAGVPAGVVQNTEDLIERDENLRDREHWQWLDHAEMGRSLYDAPPFKLSATPGRLRRPAPLLGEHTAEVLQEVLGLSEEEIAQYASVGALR